MTWNFNEPDFQNYWVWQFGSGPFEVVEISDVPAEPGRLGGVLDGIEIHFQPGRWFSIFTPESVLAKEYPNLHTANHVMFHEKWLLIV